MERGVCIHEECHVLCVRLHDAVACHPRECAPTVRHLTGEKKAWMISCCFRVGHPMHERLTTRV